MKKEVGIWVDHRRAVIVTINDGIAATKAVVSNMEKDGRFTSKTDANLSSNVRPTKAEDMRDRKFGNHLNLYYDGIISLIRDADSIWIFGPGAAKVELENRLKNADLGARVVGINPVEKMTTPQIIAKVRAHYLR